MFTSPKTGAILPAQQNTGIPNPGPNATGEAMNEWLQAQAQDQAFRANQVLATDYQNQFQNTWLVNYNSGRLYGPTGIQGDPNATPLQPPFGFVVIVVNASGGINS